MDSAEKDDYFLTYEKITSSCGLNKRFYKFINASQLLVISFAQYLQNLQFKTH